MRQAVLIIGTFNPITNAHIHIGEMARKALPEAKVIYVPARDDFLMGWKSMDEKMVLNENERFNLVRKSIAPFGFEASDIEIKKIVDGKTIHTAEYFKNEMGYDEVYFCMGTDKIPELHLWYEGTRLISEYKFLIIGREKNTLEEVMTEHTKACRGNFFKVEDDGKYADISSTKIRNAYINGKLDEVKNDIPEEVYLFLKERKELFRNGIQC